MLFKLLTLFSAGFLGGVLNSIAGGGSFITFPALLFFGVPPISANATNTFASCAGYLSGAYAFLSVAGTATLDVAFLAFSGCINDITALSNSVFA